MAIILQQALLPNLVQTLAGTPALVHLGPFANIAHGCNSIMATNVAMQYSDYVITEAGFGADLGAEKFLDFKCREMNIQPSVVVIVAIEALRVMATHPTDSPYVVFGQPPKNAPTIEPTPSPRSVL